MRPRISSLGLFLPPVIRAGHVYPEHLAGDRIDALPASFGVYRFLDARGRPLYIGKSVNIRSRVLAHLRTPEEAVLLEGARSIDCIRTAGEIGALLLESQLIKQWQPPHNAQLKVAGEAYALRLESGERCPQAACRSHYEDEDAALFGLYGSRAAAEEALQLMVRELGLCPARLGLETAVRGRPCFSYQLKRCRGACIGEESPLSHDRRLRAALRALQKRVWPFSDPIGIVEEDGDLRQVHVIDRWRYAGSLSNRRRSVARARGEVDMDVFRIVAGPLRRDELRIVDCCIEGDRIRCVQ